MPPARGRAACNICRSRKQKCDGIRPACSRCRSFGSLCTWPTVLKRGPPKGYTKALEARLRETELVLIRVLHATNDEGLLARAFHEDTQRLAHKRPDERIAELKTLGVGEHKMLALMDHWERFPLRKADDVRLWVEEASKNSVLQDGRESQSNEEIRGPLRAQSPSGNVSYQQEAEVQRPAGAGDDMAAESPCHDNAVDQGIIAQSPPETELVDTILPPKPASETHEVRNITASSRIELPAGFKDQFLW
ncbi:hypothetical protein FCIRC_11623 [Fusarium circinatum]|uniref:Zn(2)-C6 fungal-type domain-containing protein n=1 Tax=Fusarium circinatum TaxID=48490 RepID=A0A8H5T302_FUSCI|nr:hypothetical protein FCIRC_11623 [Fusarium circinatum]